MILEGFVAFDCEASVVVARSLEGAMVAYDLCENEHDRHILARTHVPARVAPGVEAAAKALAAKAIEALDYVGVLAVELFVARDAAGGARLLVNEIGAAGPQFRPLDDRGRADLAVRAAHPRHRRLAARQPGAAGANRDVAT